MTAQHLLIEQPEESRFTFKRQARQFEPAKSIPFRWPFKAAVANEYIEEWRKCAGSSLAALKLSKATMECIASHLSRKDGTCRMTNQAISARNGRSFASTKRDIHRLKMLGFLIVDYLPGDSRQERVRVLKISLPYAPRSAQRIPQQNIEMVGSTYGLCVEPLDKGDRRNV